MTRPGRSGTGRLDAAGAMLIARLAASDVSLRETTRKFPHVVNRLGAIWTSPGLLERAMNELLLTQRPRRQGFPPAVVRELVAFWEFQQRWIRWRRRNPDKGNSPKAAAPQTKPAALPPQAGAGTPDAAPPKA
ncbi:MAG TPA: hypothetical protein VM491_13700 [Burkholderiaceae bacterium]|nr:hypothetical protein [Burkholderiaceae bacterium]